MSPSAASSPVLGALPETKVPPSRPSPVPAPVPTPVPRPTTSRARQNSIQSNSEASKARPPSSAAKKTNGNIPSTPEIAQAANWPRPSHESEPTKEPAVTVKTEPSPKEPENLDDKPVATPIAAPTTTSSSSRRNSKVEETDRRSEPTQPTPQSAGMVTTKSGRASKPSTPALPSFQDAAAARPRTTRNVEPISNGKKTQKKGITGAQALAQLVDEDGNSSMQGDDGDDDADVDADEATYCYCNSISYGAMVACDSDDCAREWFHLACVGLKVAPSSKTKWYCPDCKERLKVGSKKNGSR
ncbi:p33ing1b ing1 [Trichoderma arundinaceum]|uniref:p33ing1b ing1 n=1 Tax=Trichoderma arundinaceum TaxID=490622 RepID=A0A395N7R5_TRIAR|nr:p33ing1b ing1 [Trichoderma arundinaceum]